MEAREHWQTQAQAAQDTLKQARREAKAQLMQVQQAAHDRLIQSEMKALAVQSGLIDIEGLKLADLSSLTLSEAGTLEGAQALIEDLKARKPYLFSGNTNPTHAAPTTKGSDPESVRTLSPEDYAHRKASYLKNTPI